MRNYVSFFVLEWTQIQSGPPPTPSAQWAVGADEDDLWIVVKNLNQGFLDGTDPNGTFEYPNDPQQAYLLLDKNTLLNLFQGPDKTNSPAAFMLWDSIIAPSQGRIQFFRTIPDSPRDTGWTDDAGVKRNPPPSEKPGKQTANVKFASLAALIGTLWGILYSIKSYRDAGFPLDPEIKFVLNAIIKNTLTQAMIDGLLGQIKLYTG